MSKQVKKPPFHEVVCQDIQIVLASLDSTNGHVKGQIALALLEALTRSYVPVHTIPSIIRELERIPQLFRENELGTLGLLFLERLQKLERELPLPRLPRPHLFVADGIH